MGSGGISGDGIEEDGGDVGGQVRRFASERGQVSHRSGQGSESAAGKFLLSRRGDLTNTWRCSFIDILFPFLAKEKSLRRSLNLGGEKKSNNGQIFPKIPIKILFFLDFLHIESL